MMWRGISGRPRAQVVGMQAGKSPVLHMLPRTAVVGRCRLIVSKFELKAPMLSALEA
jgi:hypothetical protein